MIRVFRTFVRPLATSKKNKVVPITEKKEKKEKKSIYDIENESWVKKDKNPNDDIIVYSVRRIKRNK